MPCLVTQDVDVAVSVLRRGGLVAFPTETVYGLGANALDPLAVAKIFDAKQRPRFDPIIVHVAGVEWLERVVREVPEVARRLAEQFWPGPLTLVLPKADRVPEIVTAGLPTCGVRAPDHPLAQQLIRRADLPVAAPSANRFGQLSPTRPEHVQAQLGDRIDVLLDGGPCRVGVESTVLDVTSDPPRLLRPGGVPVEELEAVLGKRVERVPTGGSADEPTDRPQSSPGRLPQHYAPRTRLVLLSDPSEVPRQGRVGLLSFRPVEPPGPSVVVEVLSARGDLVEAAANFFAALHRLDSLNLDLICALPFPDHGLGQALNDRLQRAAAKS